MKLKYAMASSDYCVKYNINTELEYLNHWVTSVVKNPNQPLPYIHLTGDGAQAWADSILESLPDGVKVHVGADFPLSAQLVVISDGESLLGDKTIGTLMKKPVLVEGRVSYQNRLHFIQVGGIPPQNVFSVEVEVHESYGYGDGIQDSLRPRYDATLDVEGFGRALA